MRQDRVGSVVGDTLLLLLVSFPLLSLPAKAGAMEGYEKESRAHNEYYDGMKRLGPKATKEQRNALREKTVQSATIEKNNGILKAWEAEDKKTRQHIYDKLKKKIGAKLIPSWVMDPGSGSKKGKSGGTSGSGASQGTTVAPTPTYKREEVILDGSGVPKEIEFEPRAKPSSSPRPKGRR